MQTKTATLGDTAEIERILAMPRALGWDATTSYLADRIELVEAIYATLLAGDDSDAWAHAIGGAIALAHRRHAERLVRIIDTPVPGPNGEGWGNINWRVGERVREATAVWDRYRPLEYGDPFAPKRGPGDPLPPALGIPAGSGPG